MNLGVESILHTLLSSLIKHLYRAKTMTVKFTDQIQKGEMVELKYFVFTPTHLIDYISISILPFWN